MSTIAVASFVLAVSNRVDSFGIVVNHHQVYPTWVMYSWHCVYENKKKKKKKREKKREYDEK